MLAFVAVVFVGSVPGELVVVGSRSTAVSGLHIVVAAVYAVVGAVVVGAAAASALQFVAAGRLVASESPVVAVFATVVVHAFAAVFESLIVEQLGLVLHTVVNA